MLKRTINQVLLILCIATFVATVATSIPLFIPYLRNVPIRNDILQDLHVWFGVASVIFVSFRILLNRKFVTNLLKQLTKTMVKRR